MSQMMGDNIYIYKKRELTKISPVITHATGPQEVAKKAM